MKNIIKKWWFWLTVIIALIGIGVFINEYKENKELERKFEIMGTAATEFYNELQNAKGYSDYIIYNYETNEVEYHPPITIKTYNRIEEGMTEKEVISIIGNGEKLQPEGSIGFLMTWGDLDLSKSPYYIIQITFDEDGKVKSKSQVGLE